MEKITTREQLDWRIKNTASTGIMCMIHLEDEVNFEMAQVAIDALKKEFRQYIKDERFAIALNKFYLFDKFTALTTTKSADRDKIVKLAYDAEVEMRKELLNALKVYLANDGLIY